MSKFKYGPYSPSRLETGTCGYAFRKQYIDKTDKAIRVEGLAQARGSAVHEVLDQITQRLIKEQVITFSEGEVRELVCKAVNNHPAAYQEIDTITEMAKLYIRNPPKVLTEDAGVELRLAIKPKLNADGSLKTYMDDKVFEKPVERICFEECNYDDPDAWARGRADIMLISDDTTWALVYDHKTQPNVEDADTFQMGFYAWVISRIYPFLSEIHTVLHFARYSKYSEPYIWTQQDLYKIEDSFLTRAGVIETKEIWDAVPHKNCQYCPFLAECPVMGEFVSVDERGSASVAPASQFRILGNQSKAVQIAGLLNVLEEAVGMAKSELRSFVQASEGRVAIPGKVYEYRADEGINWDKVNKMKLQVYAVFEKHNVDPKAFMSFNQTASKMIWLAQSEALIRELSEIFPRKASSEFRGYKS